MSSAQPELKYIKSFNVTGLSTRTQNADEFNEKTAKLPGLWQQFYNTDLAANPGLFEVYSDYESDANGLYTVTLGVSDHQSDADNDLVTINVPAGDYLVFQGSGPMPSVVVETWQRIWAYFAANPACQRNFICDFEAYTSHDTVAIHIGVKHP